jgi:hypothetical protein
MIVTKWTLFQNANNSVSVSFMLDSSINEHIQMAFIHVDLAIKASTCISEGLKRIHCVANRNTSLDVVSFEVTHLHPDANYQRALCRKPRR